MDDAALTGTMTTRPPNSRQRAPKDPELVLTQLARTLRTHVEGMTAGLPMRNTTRFLDGRQECVIGSTGDWPAQWIFDERVFLTTQDARPAGRQIAQRYAARGWTVTAKRPLRDAEQYTLRINGFVIEMSAAKDDGSISLQSSGPCVNGDGSLLP